MDTDLIKENRILKQRVETLEGEVRLLRNSVLELTSKLSPTIHQRDREDGEINLENSTGDNNAREGRTFQQKSEFKGHGGAVYSIKFSPCGKMFASGSFDTTVRIWDTTSLQKELKGHKLNVSDVSWSNDSTSILSGAFDQTCKLWDIETSRCTHSFENEGFVQCVMFNPADNNVFASGTSRNRLTILDKRKSEDALKFKNEGKINTLYVWKDGQNIFTGDSNGYLKTWDIRAGSALHSLLNDQTKKPISNIAVSKKCPNNDEEPRYIAVNSYDNVIRIYDRETPNTQMKLIHVLKGHKNKGWPIKSSYFYGKDYSFDVIYEEDKPLEASLLLATGSADPYIYLYNVGGPENTGELIQKLKGHTDFVYAIDFHPTEPILISGSADSTIKIWIPNAKGKKKN